MKKRKFGRKPAWQIRIAKERIKILFDLALKEFKKHPERSRRYIQLLRKIGLRYNVRLPKELKRKFCKKCFNLFIPGYSCEIRLNDKTKTVNIKCLRCNKIYRYPYR
jgi:ribonuclease P protein subunit RPR2